MCGIAGIYSPVRSIDKLTNIAVNMSDSILHRGPDDSGVWVDKKNNLALSHRRLSIIDTSNGGHQPMSSGCRRYIIVFNGEIYNYLELRNELKSLGFKFKSTSDTEVLIKSYLKWDLNFVEKIRGMFSIIIFDSIKKKNFVF